jgi:diaminopimelate epimerase
VRFVQGDVSEVDVVSLGRSIRWSQPWGAVGTNVNFVQVLGLGHAAVRTYERGVEDETWSCGTGVTAVAEVLRRNQPGCPPSVYISTPGGKLAVHFLPGEAPWLEGPAQFVFQGHITSPTHA